MLAVVALLAAMHIFTVVVAPTDSLVIIIGHGEACWYSPPPSDYDRLHWLDLFRLPGIYFDPGTSLATLPNRGIGVFGIPFVSIPVWPVCAVTLVTLAIFRQPSYLPPGHCPDCGYDLRYSSTPRCSECGSQREVA